MYELRAMTDEANVYLRVSDLHFCNSTGTTQRHVAAALQCSGAAPCTGIELHNNTFSVAESGKPAKEYLCSHVVEPSGFKCTGGCGHEDELCPD